MNTATSSYLNRPKRGEAEVRVAPFLTADTYHILAAPKDGEFYHVEMEWPEMNNRRMCIDRLRQCDDAAYVVTRGGKDVSEPIARELVAIMADHGNDYDAIASVKFISRHLVDSDILALTKGK